MKTQSLFFLFVVIFTCNSCQLFNSNPDTNKKQWVYVEINTASKTDTTDYFFYGQIKKSIVQKISSNENIHGLFLLDNIRFKNDDELLEIYENETYEGSLVFKIQDIEEIVFYKDDPVLLFDVDVLHESSKKLREQSKKKDSL